MLTKTPVATSATNRLERPYEMNGSVMPVAGRSARVTAMWSAAVTPINAVRPTASNWPNESPADRAMRKPTHTKLPRSEEHTSELQSQSNLVCRLLLEKKKTTLNENAPDNYTPPTMST